jgi:hypothetical protein
LTPAYRGADLVQCCASEQRLPDVQDHPYLRHDLNLYNFVRTPLRVSRPYRESPARSPSRAVASAPSALSLSDLFLERIVGATLLNIASRICFASRICRWIGQSLDTLLFTVGIGWTAFAIGSRADSI